MKIYVKVKPSAKENGVERLDDAHYSIRVKAKPADGKANDATRRLLAEYFGVSASRVALLRGATSREKVFEIL